MTTPPKRITIVGGPGGGKTTLAGRLAELMQAPVLDLDGSMLRLAADMPKPLDLDALLAVREAEIEQFVTQESWIGEGAFLGEERLLLKLADLVVWLDLPWPVASRRILLRHLKASLARNNRFPSLVDLYKFWRWSAGYYAGRNPHRLNDWRSPNTRNFLEECLQPYRDKLMVCQSDEEAGALVSQIRDLALNAAPG